jgi:hypothetical protein
MSTNWLLEPSDRVFGTHRRAPPGTGIAGVRRALQQRATTSRYRSRHPVAYTTLQRFTVLGPVERTDRLGGLLHEYRVAA